MEQVAGEPGIEAVAVVLLHSYAHPEHERLLGELLAARLPGVHVSLSHELVGTFREYERAATTEVDAALSPLLGAYLRRLGERPTRWAARPAVMQSSGGLTDARGGRRARGADGALGPGRRRPRRAGCWRSWRESATCSASTWAAPRATSA